MATIRHVPFLVVQLLVISAFKFTVVVFLEREPRPILEEGYDRWVAVCDQIDIVEAKIIWIADLLFRFISTENRQPLSSSFTGFSRYIKPIVQPSTVIASVAKQPPIPIASSWMSSSESRKFFSMVSPSTENN